MPTRDIAHERVRVGDLELGVAQAGPEDGPLVILLHGFPEHAGAWLRQMPALARAGFRVWAPDQRGYRSSDKPEGIDSYQLDRLADDVVGLMDAAGTARAAVVGHDWGGEVAWWTAIRHPQRVEKLVVLNMPHPWVLFRQHLRFHLHRGWYFYFFQIPRLPEALMRVGRFSPAVRALAGNARPGAFSRAEIDELRESWSRPGAMTSMIHWYRALIRRPPDLSGDLRVRPPTLLIWGARDRFLSRRLARPSVELCLDGRLVFVEEATHWLHREEPDRVNREIGSFLGTAQSPAPQAQPAPGR